MHVRPKRRRQFLFTLLMCAITVVFFAGAGSSQLNSRREIHIPDIGGYVTLKCDFHIHTVFSDGAVWPTVRVQEAWREGLDAIALTDHIEYQPHEADVPTNHNRAFDIAKSSADALGLILVRGTEITRGMPPGHVNAVFLENVDPVDTTLAMDAVKAAAGQGGFVFYNHPDFHHPHHIAEWRPEHTELMDVKMLHGVEVVNGRSYYPDAHRWCLDKKLTMMGSSDVHQPIGMDYDFAAGEHRPVTLVFAKKRTPEAVGDALFDRRTAIWWKNFLIGEEKYLKPLFNESIEILTEELRIEGAGGATVQIRNNSDVSFELVSNGSSDYVTFPERITLHANRTVAVPVRGKSGELSGRRRVTLPYTVTNLLVAPETGLTEELRMRIRFAPVTK